MRRAIMCIGMAAVLWAAAPAQAAPPVPSSTKKARKCGKANNGFADFKVYIGKGRKRITCKKARSVVSKGMNAKGWTYYDWTKGGSGPWSDVWVRHDRKVVVLAIVIY
jgi:hypothetical protein